MSKRNIVHREKRQRELRFQPKIVVSKFGEVYPDEISRTLVVVKECYNRLAPHEVALVDLYFFERSSSTQAFLAKEFKQVGVLSAPFDELFFAMHDAWRGTSRIILCLEKMRKLPRLVQTGGIRHEVGHSVLHGSLSYYLFPLPLVLSRLSKRFNLSPEYAMNLLYLIAIAVKDYEVSRLLQERGYIKDQIAYLKHVLAVSENDILSWELSRGKPPAQALCLVSSLKPVGCAIPFFPQKKFGASIKLRVTEGLSYLPRRYSTLLLETALEVFSSLDADTLNNIAHVTRLITENIVEPMLQ